MLSALHYGWSAAGRRADPVVSTCQSESARRPNPQQMRRRPHRCTERRGRVVSTPDSYSGVPGF
jgi:hypothetical protein